jgi:2',3'-cyclic-nucleotide 2'-phosphodiesterase (5'-nucleotidase family)
MPAVSRRTLLGAALVGVGVLSLSASQAWADVIRAEVDLNTHDIGSKETVIGDLVADAIKAQAKSDIAFIPASSFADVVIPKGSISTNDVLKTLDNAYKSDSIVVVKLTGEQIAKALEQSVYLHPSSFNGFLSVSGVTGSANDNADREKRVSSVRVNGDSLENSKVYRVAMPAPLADGAYMYFKIWKKSDIQKDTGKSVESAVTAYLTDHKTITKGDDRLVFKNK